MDQLEKEFYDYQAKLEREYLEERRRRYRLCAYELDYSAFQWTDHYNDSWGHDQIRKEK